MKVLFILGYGIFQAEDERYAHYLEESLVHITEQKPEWIVLCGGYSNPKYQGVSEAASMAGWLIEKDPSLKDRIILEEESLTTFHNLKKAQLLLQERGIVPTVVSIICDSIRLPKTYFLAMAMYKEWLRLPQDEAEVLRQLANLHENVGLDVTKDLVVGTDIITVYGIARYGTAEEIGQQIVGSILEVRGLDHPELEEEFLARRRRRFGIDA